MRLPDIKNFKLNDWQPEAFKQWQDLIYSLGQQVAGKHTKGFEEKVAEIKGWNGNGYDRDFNEFLDDRLALRALTWLWVSDTAFRKRFFKNEMLEHLLRKKTWLGNLVVIELISLYLKEYDKLDIEAGNESPKILNKLRNLIKSQLAIFSKRKAVRRKNPKNMAVEKNIIDAFIHHKDMLISDSSALKTSSYAVKYNLDLQDLFNRIGLKGFDDGRFADQCRFLFYILDSTLKCNSLN
ncbi:hypothetical protein [Marinospirillum insulare]|uniref:Uncharacterized protein n=1 Tax=Marinospirillum insulare TaxID=217169 RepID=A0ABQ5ZW95_9GAMM|nr:hypothetical protein [Marinospirillum insulare]GLR64434.1 hypothetical protein GCM10007878_18720 [Marinospirillum insulare]